MDAPGRAVYELKTVLRKIEPPIWRSIQVWDDTPLADLHRILQIVFGWENKHLYEFAGGGHTYRPPESGRVPLNRLLVRTGDEIEYVYDFGDNWRHVVLLDARLRPDEDALYPRYVGGERSAPPENMGGPYAYLRNPAIPPASQLSSIDDINAVLRTAFPKPLKRVSRRGGEIEGK